MINTSFVGMMIKLSDDTKSEKFYFKNLKGGLTNSFSCDKSARFMRKWRIEGPKAKVGYTIMHCMLLVLLGLDSRQWDSMHASTIRNKAFANRDTHLTHLPTDSISILPTLFQVVVAFSLCMKCPFVIINRIINRIITIQYEFVTQKIKSIYLCIQNSKCDYSFSQHHYLFGLIKRFR